jgi:hypothetical protein
MVGISSGAAAISRPFNGLLALKMPTKRLSLFRRVMVSAILKHGADSLTGA